MCGQTTLDDWPVHLFPEGHPDRKPRGSGHAPAMTDLRFPRMGGKPSKGTKKDKRIKKNRRGK